MSRKHRIYIPPHVSIHSHPVILIINILHWCSSFVTIDEPIWVHYDWLKSSLYQGSPRAVQCVGFNKCVLICIHHHSIIQNSFTALKFPYFFPPQKEGYMCMCVSVYVYFQELLLRNIIIMLTSSITC